jgi:hypothetical protein
MHDRQYRDYKSGAAKKRFLKEIEEKQAEMSKGHLPKSLPAKLLPSPEAGIAFLYSGATATYWPDEETPQRWRERKKGEILMYLMIGKTIREVVSDRDGTVKHILVKER